MERFKRLFRDAERIKPTAAMWKNIAAGTELASAEKAGKAARAGEGGYVWRLAASMAIGLGVLAAMLTVISDPKGKAARAQALKDSTAMASAATANGIGASGAWNGLVDEDVLNWHADLGEGAATEWEIDPMLSDPTLDATDE